MSPHISAEMISRFLIGELTDQEQEIVESHLELCPDCEALAMAASPQDPLVSLLSATVVEPMPAEADVHAGLESSTAKPGSLGPTWCDRMAHRVATADERDIPTIAGLSDHTLPVLDPPAELASHPRYKIIRPLGRGGMGTVWLAQHLVMDRLVALKVIRSELLSKAGALERFRREVMAAAKLHHPNVVTAFDAEQVGNTLFLVVEYINGETLSELASLGPMNVPDASRAIRDAALGLHHAHTSGMIHRDIKPGNLIRTADGIVKVLDFGLVVIPNESSSITGDNMVVGTPDYIAPEQAEDPRRADVRSDIYSLGCTLHHLLIGQAPFAGLPTLGKLDAHRRTPPQLIDNIPVGLQQIVTKMIAKDPQRRFQTALEVASSLKRYCDTDDAISVPPQSWLRNRVAGLAAATAFALLLLLLSGALLNSLGKRKLAVPAVTSVDSTSIDPVDEADFNDTSFSRDEANTKIHSLLIPVAIGDGHPEDFHVEGQQLSIDALTRSAQVWLDYKCFESKRFSITTKVRFLELTALSQLKVALLSDFGPEYNIQFRRDKERDWVLVKKIGLRPDHSFSEIGVAKHFVSLGAVGEWVDLAIRLDNDRLTVQVRDEIVIDCVCEDVVVRFPAIAVNGCRIDLLSPTATEFD